MNPCSSVLATSAVGSLSRAVELRLIAMKSKKQQLDIEAIRKRTPARRIIEIPERTMLALSDGMVATMNLTEWLATDRQKLLTIICKQVGLSSNDESNPLWTPELLTQSALKQSFAIGRWLSGRIKIGDDAWRLLSTHESDIVREWASIIIGLADNISLARKLAWIKPFADDEHSGLREIAWLALRSEVLRDPVSAIKCLAPWTGSRHERLRRYASEITRPRGVWCSHIPLLKDKPELALSILEPLRADDSKYVKNSVGNWLNDASKSQPEWVRATAKCWLAESSSPHTQYIVKRALRNVGERLRPLTSTTPCGRSRRATIHTMEALLSVSALDPFLRGAAIALPPPIP